MIKRIVHSSEGQSRILNEDINTMEINHPSF